MKHVFYDLVDGMIELRVYNSIGWCVWNEDFKIG